MAPRRRTGHLTTQRHTNTHTDAYTHARTHTHRTRTHPSTHAARDRPCPGPARRPADLAEYYVRARGQTAERQKGWAVRKPAGTYQVDDSPGCFRCGSMDHWARDCIQQTPSEAASSSAARRCQSCQALVADVAARFCGQCGTPLP